MSFGESLSNETSENSYEENSSNVSKSIDSSINVVSSDQQTNDSQSSLSEWYISKNGGMKGSGDRPEWLKEKYGFDAFKQAEAYPHAERKISELTNKIKELEGTKSESPAEYELTIPEEFDDLVDDNDVSLNSFFDEAVEVFKNSNVDQETFSKVSNSFFKFLDNYYKDAQQYEDNFIKEEISKIGPDAKKQFSELKTWIDQNYQGVDSEKLMKNIPNAEFFFELKKMRDGSPSTSIPRNSNSSGNEQSHDQLRKNLLDPRIRTDEVFRQRTMDGYRKLFGNN